MSLERGEVMDSKSFKGCNELLRNRKVLDFTSCSFPNEGTDRDGEVKQC